MMYEAKVNHKKNELAILIKDEVGCKIRNVIWNRSSEQRWNFTQGQKVSLFYTLR